MEHVTPYEHDIFISYAHIDDTPLMDGEVGWVSGFHKTLESFIKQILGKEPAIWRDPKLQGKDVDKESIAESTATITPTTATSPLEIFKACGGVVELVPKDCEGSFEPGKIYAFVRIRAPEPQTLTLKWFDTNNKVFKKREIEVKESSEGYRT